MSPEEIRNICLHAGMIVSGYAFTKKEDSNILVLQIHAPYHALIFSRDGEVLETCMDDVELNIVKEYWQKNRKYMEEAYA